MIELFRKRVLLLCNIALILGLVSTVASLCLIAHFKLRVNDRTRLEQYAMDMITAYRDKQTPADPSHGRFFCLAEDAEGETGIYHLSKNAIYNQDEALALGNAIIRSGMLSGEQSGHLFQVHLEGSDILLMAEDISPSYKLIQRMILVSLFLSLIVLLFSNLFLLTRVKRILEPVIEAGQMQFQFISDVGHELKTPLSVISANTEVMELVQGKNQWTTTILHQIDRMSSLINHMLLLTSLQQDKKEKVLYELGEKLTMEVDNFDVLMEQKLVTCHMDIDQSIKIVAVPVQMNQVIMELLSNAVKYVSDHGMIRVSLTKLSSQAVLKVWNTHPPLGKEDLKRIFERFYRVDASRSRETGGFGIGLSAAATVVKMHGGKISAHNEGQGICFEILLPLTEE